VQVGDPENKLCRLPGLILADQNNPRQLVLAGIAERIVFASAARRLTGNFGRRRWLVTHAKYRRLLPPRDDCRSAGQI